MVTKHTLFKPSKAETKADSTTQIAKGIIESEKIARDAKTNRLRAARLERKAAEDAAPAPAKPAAKKSRKKAAPSPDK